MASELKDSNMSSELDTNALSTFSTGLDLEKTRQGFSPELQNTVAALIAARDPISIDLITDFASNEAGKPYSNPVKVTTDQVVLVIQVFQEAERRFGVQLLETGPVAASKERQGDEETLKLGTGNDSEIAFPNSSLERIGYKFTNSVQRFVETRYPLLYMAANRMIAENLWSSLFDDEEPKTEAVSTLIAPGEELGQLVDGAAQNARLLGSGEVK